MAVQIPIISEFDGTGVKKAVAQFKQLETTGQKAQFALKKAAVPATAALAGLTAVLVSATKGAMEDAAAQTELARQLEISTSATDAQVAAVEAWISAQGKALGVADDDLRPAFAKLARATNDITEAQTAATLAMDISAGTGKSLETVTTALEKAYGGNLNALAKLDPSVRGMIKDGASLSEVMNVLGGTFGGAATEAANTAEGGFKRLSLSLSETKESIGAALLPVVQAVLPYLQAFGSWAQENPNAFLAIAAAIGAVSVAIIAVNAAMALNPFTAIAAGVALLVVGLVAAYKKFEWFRNGVNGVIDDIIGVFETWANAWIMALNAVIRAWNLVPGHDDVGTIGHVNFGGGGGSRSGGRLAVPAMAEGGIVTSPTLALIGEAGPEAVVPLNKMGGMGVNITVNTGVGDKDAISRQIVEALQQYDRNMGGVPIRTK